MYRVIIGRVGGGWENALNIVFSGIIGEMSGQSCLISLLGSLPDHKSSLHSLLQGMENQARIMMYRIGKASANGMVEEGQAGYAPQWMFLVVQKRS
jgi:hypothetical protein